MFRKCKTFVVTDHGSSIFRAVPLSPRRGNKRLLIVAEPRYIRHARGMELRGRCQTGELIKRGNGEMTCNRMRIRLKKKKKKNKRREGKKEGKAENNSCG